MHNTRRNLDRIRRHRRAGLAGRGENGSKDLEQPRSRHDQTGQTSGGVGWDRDSVPERPVSRPLVASAASVSSQILSLLADPQVLLVSEESAAAALNLPRADVRAAIALLEQSGELVAATEQGVGLYRVSSEQKAYLEAVYRTTAEDMGEITALVPVTSTEYAIAQYNDDVPRLPVTAGVLSVFLPGTGQLLNGDVVRAALIFVIWGLAFLTNILPIWSFVALYAGAEAFFTAKLRGMERELASESAITEGDGTKPPGLPKGLPS